MFRADDIRAHQNILKDIISALAESALIVADLTGSNPNVYYELGLAHAFRKRVILLTQQVDDLPFDLRSYRVIPYSTYFAEVAKAKSLQEFPTSFWTSSAQCRRARSGARRSRSSS